MRHTSTRGCQQCPADHPMNTRINSQVRQIKKVSSRLWCEGAKGSADRSSKPMTSLGLTPNLHPRIFSQSQLQPRTHIPSALFTLRIERIPHGFANLSAFNFSNAFSVLGGRFCPSASGSRLAASFSVQCALNSSAASSAEDARLVDNPTVAQLEALIERPPLSTSAYDAGQIQVRSERSSTGGTWW